MSQARTLIEALVAGRHNPRLRGERKTCAVAFTDDDRVLVEVVDGAFAMADSDADVDCELSCSLDDFLQIFRGEQNLITAIMQGRVGVKGDLAVAQMFHSVFSPGTQRAPLPAR